MGSIGIDNLYHRSQMYNTYSNMRMTPKLNSTCVEHITVSAAPRFFTSLLSRQSWKTKQYQNLTTAMKTPEAQLTGPVNDSEEHGNYPMYWKVGESEKDQLFRS